MPTIPTGWATNSGQRLRRRPARHLADAEILGEQQVADDIERVVAGLGHDVGHRPALPAEVLGPPEGTEPNVRPARLARVGGTPGLELAADAVARRPVGKALLERARSARLDPLRELDEQPRRGPLVGIGVEGDVETLGAGVVDERQHRLGPAGMGLAVVEVGDVGRGAGATADLDRLAERVEVAVAERVADVGVVEAAVPAGLIGERGKLIGRRVRRRAGSRAPRLSPKAPSAIPSSSRPRIRSIALASAGTSSQPSAAMRSGELPTSVATLRLTVPS